MNPRIVRNSGDIEVLRNGTVTWYQAKYQLAPAVTKKAPDKNLHASFQNVFFFNWLFELSNESTEKSGNGGKSKDKPVKPAGLLMCRSKLNCRASFKDIILLENPPIELMLDTTFCDMLESKIQGALQNSANQEIRSYWCDGVLLPTFEHDYTQKFVNDNRHITLTAFIGQDGQDTYQLKLLFGNKALSKYARGLSISDCIPEVEDYDWFRIDSEKREVLVQLL